MIEVVKVRLREGGKILDYDANGLELSLSARVIVPTPDGLTLGTVVSNPQRLDEEYVKTSFRKVVRTASPEDEERVRRHQDLERSAFAFCQRQIKELRLPMKLVEVEHLFEGGKAVFYFTAEGRVDFRQLVKELAHECRIRIEMRQIGVRDEARMIGGYGICGRELCCASFLSEFEPISKTTGDHGLGGDGLSDPLSRHWDERHDKRCQQSHQKSLPKHIEGRPKRIEKKSKSGG